MMVRVKALLERLRALAGVRVSWHGTGLRLWMVPALIVLGFVLAQWLVGSLAVALGYLVLAFFIFDYGIFEKAPPLRRAGSYFLGLAVLLLAVGRGFYWMKGGVMPSGMGWILDTGHLSLFVAIALLNMDARESEADA
jgi:hypothetical protein